MFGLFPLPCAVQVLGICSLKTTLPTCIFRKSGAYILKAKPCNFFNLFGKIDTLKNSGKGRLL